MTAWYIMGFTWPAEEKPYYRGEIREPYKFVGEVYVRGDTLQGFITDTSGSGTITGKISPESFTFTKRSREFPSMTIYSFKTCRLQNGLSMGWRGVWRTEGGAGKGEAACLLFPNAQPAEAMQEGTPQDPVVL